jgi:hypothetical protein
MTTRLSPEANTEEHSLEELIDSGAAEPAEWVNKQGTRRWWIMSPESNFIHAWEAGAYTTLVHFSAQPEPFLTLKTALVHLNTPCTPALNTP